MHTKTWARKARQIRDQAKHDMHENHTSTQARHLADPKQINYVQPSNLLYINAILKCLYTNKLQSNFSYINIFFVSNSLEVKFTFQKV